MGPVEVVVLHPGLQVVIALVGVLPVTGIGPFPQSGLDEAFGLAIGSWGVGTSEAVRNIEFRAGLSKLAGAIAGAVIGQQTANGDAVELVKGDGIVEKLDRGFCLLIGQQP